MVGRNWNSARAPTGTFTEHVSLHSTLGARSIGSLNIHDYCRLVAAARAREIKRVVPPL
jgi:hypothetical protein